MKNLHFWMYRTGRHVTGWLLMLVLLGCLIWYNSDSARVSELTIYSLFSIGVFALAIYSHFWLLNNLLERHRYIEYGVTTSAIIMTSGILLSIGNHFLQVLLHDDGGHQVGVWMGAANIVIGVALATGASYTRRGLVGYFQVQQVHAQQLETELTLLKAKVNQHFLFNTLNNLYGLSLAAPEQIPEALLQLAGLMRYQLDNVHPDQVTVASEAEYLANYIGLERLRLRENTSIEFEVRLLNPELSLAPLLLLPLVENCFKHAIGTGGKNTIRICLIQTERSLTLQTENSIPPHFQPVPSGLGLPTLRARLAHYYPDPRHILNLESKVDHYSAKLTLLL